MGPKHKTMKEQISKTNISLLVQHRGKKLQKHRSPATVFFTRFASISKWFTIQSNIFSGPSKKKKTRKAEVFCNSFTLHSRLFHQVSIRKPVSFLFQHTRQSTKIAESPKTLDTKLKRAHNVLPWSVFNTRFYCCCNV